MDEQDIKPIFSGSWGTNPGGDYSKNREKHGEKFHRWVVGKVSSAVGDIPLVSTELNIKDILGSWKVRLGIRRMNYKIKPGLYGIGNPTSESPVLVTANSKLSFDRLRKELSGLDTWIMVLDTKGVNVWCSAGKGTFGTEEVVKRIQEVSLFQIVSHRNLILPQLAAPGVAAHEVKKQSGFKVFYGPIRAIDIKEFLKAGIKATPEMRTVKFGFLDRMVLTPIDLVGILYPVLFIASILILLGLLGLRISTLKGILPYVGAIIVGCVLVPAFLPWIPGRAFALKGWILGVLFALAVNIHYGFLFSPAASWKAALSYFLALPALSSFLAMNFTGSSTYTSLSGVVREMKVALPLIIISGVLGLVLGWL
jgi:hypothetical protein